MSKLTLRKYKQCLQKKVVVLEAGKRHKEFSYSIFKNLPIEYRITLDTLLVNNEIHTVVSYAGDISRNFIEPYILKEIDIKNKCVHVSPMSNKGSFSIFYIDAVALIPKELVNSKWKLELLDEKEIIDLNKNRKKENANSVK